jgi:hypothetical protein
MDGAYKEKHIAWPGKSGTKTSHSQFWGNSNEGTPYNPTYFTYEKLPITLCVILVFKQTCKYNEMGGTYYEFRKNTR